MFLAMPRWNAWSRSAQTTTAPLDLPEPEPAFQLQDLSGNAITLYNLPRLSTETQRRNGFRQSTAPERSVRIIEDIINGNYVCTICTEEILDESPRAFDMWHCRECYNVFHFNCIESWAEASADGLGLQINVVLPWRCPCCAIDRTVLPTATCWCGAERLGDHDPQSNVPNACLNVCWAPGSCRHGNPQYCQKPCHPGPCDLPCPQMCILRQRSEHPANWPFPQQVAVGANPRNWATRWERFWQRRPGSISDTLVLLGILVLFYILINIFIIYHAKWWIEPCKYRRFVEVDILQPLEICLITIGGTFLSVPMFVLIGESLKGVAACFSSVCKFDDASTMTRGKRIVKFWGKTFLYVFGSVLLVYPFIGVGAGPTIGWYYQMRNSCDGYDTRIRMDQYVGIKNSKPSPETEFKIRSLLPTVEGQIFHLGSHVTPISKSQAGFQRYHRLAGSTSGTPYIAVDVDLKEHTWRLMHLDDEDLANTWSAKQFKEPAVYTSPSKAPQFARVNSTLVWNGTFTKVDADAPNMYIPQMDLVIAGMYDFERRCEYEPFLRVFYLGQQQHRGNNSSGKLKLEQQLPLSKWSNKNNPAVVMRTAGFGYRWQALDMCVREGPVVRGAPGAVVRAGAASTTNSSAVGAAVGGMRDEMFVPFAIISAVRARLEELKQRGFDCRD